LPLALEQASAYLDQTGERLGTYAKQLDSSMGRLLSNGRVDSSLSSVATTWTLSFRRVARESSASADLLRLCAFLAPDSIPLDLIERSVAELKRSPKLQRALRDRLELNSIVWVLLRFSLVKRQGDSLSIHRLVQAVVRELLPSGAKRRWAGTAVRILAAAMPVESWSVPNWPMCERILPHVLTSADHALECQCEQGKASSLLNRAGAYLVSRGEFSLAQRLVERAVSVGEHVLGPDHLQTAASLSNLGAVLLVQGELAPAKSYLERALAIKASRLEPDDPVVANGFSSLGLVLLAQGNLTDAKQHFEQALAIVERVLGPDHPITARTLNNLGQVLMDQGDLVHARKCLERAMWLRQRVSGEDDLSKASTLNDMGLLLQAEGDLPRAATHMERALHICERVVGARYPDLATIVNNLGTVLQARGDLATARMYYERALELRERLFGPDHLTTAGSLNNLGALLALQGGLVAARSCLERALPVFERVVGPDHPHTAASLNNMGALVQAEGRLAISRTYYERGLAICQRILTRDHPYTAACRENLRALQQAGIEGAPRGYYLIDANDGSMKPRVALIGSHLNYIEAGGPTQPGLSGISGARVIRAAGRVGSWGQAIRTQVQRHAVKR